MTVTATRTGVVNEQGLVQVLVEDPDIGYRDALYVPAATTRTQFVAAATARWQAFKAQLAAPPVEATTTLADVRRGLDALNDAMDALDRAATVDEIRAARLQLAQARLDMRAIVAQAR